MKDSKQEINQPDRDVCNQLLSTKYRRQLLDKQTSTPWSSGYELDFQSGDPGSIPGIGCFSLCTLLFMPQAVECFCNPVTLEAESLGKVMRRMRCLACLIGQMPSPGGEVGNWHGMVTCRGDRHPNISR